MKKGGPKPHLLKKVDENFCYKGQVDTDLPFVCPARLWGAAEGIETHSKAIVRQTMRSNSLCRRKRQKNSVRRLASDGMVFNKGCTAGEPAKHFLRE